MTDADVCVYMDGEFALMRLENRINTDHISLEMMF